MSRALLLGLRALTLLAALWLAFVIPRWMDTGFYDQCQTFNCFTSASSAILSLIVGLATGVSLNLALSAWLRDKQILE
jgi:hypothetical protein